MYLIPIGHSSWALTLYLKDHYCGNIYLRTFMKSAKTLLFFSIFKYLWGNHAERDFLYLPAYMSEHKWRMFFRHIDKHSFLGADADLSLSSSCSREGREAMQGHGPVMASPPVWPQFSSLRRQGLSQAFFAHNISPIGNLLLTISFFFQNIFKK